MTLLCLRPLRGSSLLTKKSEHLSSSFFFYGLITQQHFFSCLISSLKLFLKTILNYLWFLGFDMISLASVLCVCGISSLTHLSLDHLFGYFFWACIGSPFFPGKHLYCISSPFCVYLYDQIWLWYRKEMAGIFPSLDWILDFRNLITISLIFWNGYMKESELLTHILEASSAHLMRPNWFTLLQFFLSPTQFKIST